MIELEWRWRSRGQPVCRLDTRSFVVCIRVRAADALTLQGEKRGGVCARVVFAGFLVSYLSAMGFFAQ